MVRVVQTLSSEVLISSVGTLLSMLSHYELSLSAREEC